MDDVHVLKPQDGLSFGNGLLKTARGGNVVPGSEQVASVQTETDGQVSHARREFANGRQFFETAADLGARAHRALSQQHKFSKLETRRGLGDAFEKTENALFEGVTFVVSWMSYQVFRADCDAALQLAAERLDRFRPNHVVGGREVDQIIVVDHQRRQIVLIARAIQQRDRRGSRGGCFPLPRARRKDLERIGAQLRRPQGCAFERLSDRRMQADPHGWVFRFGFLHNRSKVFLRAAIFLLLASAVASAADRLYLKDGTYQLTNQYEVKTDRVRYYSTERGEWEEIPLELVDLDRTKSELSERQTQLATDAKAEAEERAAEKLAHDQVAAIPTKPGVYYIRGEMTEPVKQAESKVVNNTKRTILKVLSPIPLLPGKATIELDGDHAPLRIADTRPEFYFRLSDYQRFEIVKLTPKKEARVVENLSILQVKGDREVDEQILKIDSFKKQEADLLFRIWPEKPLPPGEYALIEYTEGKMNPQIWDFTVDAK